MRKRFTPATVLAMIALFVALASSATAAGTVLITGKQIKDSSIGLADLNPTAKRSLRGQSGPVGPAGAQGATGAQGPAGAQGPTGPQGAPGPSVGTVDDLRGKPCQLPGGTSGVTTIQSGESPAGYAAPTAPPTSPTEPATLLTGGSGTHSQTLYCLTADRWENNDDRDKAADISSSKSNEYRFAAATMLPAGNDDWYKLPFTKLDSPYRAPVITVGWGEGSTVRMDVYRDGHSVASNSTEYALTDWDTATTHNWEIRVFGSTVEPYQINIQ